MFDKIIETLNKVIDELDLKEKNYEEQETIIKKELKKIMGLFNDLRIDKEDIRLLDCSEEIEIMSRLDGEIDVSKLKEKLRIISRILNGKHDSGFDWKLSDNQSKDLDNFIKLLERSIKILEKRRKLVLKAKNSVRASSEDIFNLELLIEYLDQEILPISKKDFLDYVNRITEDPNVSYSLKRELLTAVSEGNKEVEMNSMRTPVDIEELKRILIAEYDFSSKDIALIDENKELILQRANITKIREILNFMIQKKIYDKFQKDRLLPILLYGNLNFIKERYRKLVEDKNQYNMTFYDTPSIWIVSANSRQRPGRKPKSEAQKLTARQTSMYVVAHEISYEEMMKNIEFLKSIGFEPRFNDEGYDSVLRTYNNVLRSNFDICQFYNLLDNEGKVKIVTLLKSSGLVYNIDRFIELGLRYYVFGFPSRLTHTDEKLFAALYKAKEDNPPSELYGNLNSYEFQNIIFSDRMAGRLRTELTSEYLGYGLRRMNEEQLEGFYQENGRVHPVIPNQELFDQIVESSEELYISDDVFKDERIRRIEKNNRLNGDEYEYVFGNQIISRLKVLRIYSLFIGNPEINLDDAFMYSIIHNSLLDEKAYEQIKEEVGYGEKQHELS